MKKFLKSVRNIKLKYQNPDAIFHSNHYLRHNSRRLEHLASLRIPLRGKSVLEVGAGIGDLTTYYSDRGCNVYITEALQKNLKYLKKRYPDGNIHFLDMEHPEEIDGAPFDIVHCYGLLYHLRNPEQALRYMSRNCRNLLFLETAVSFGNDDEPNLISENKHSASQAFSGTGCRPTRNYIFNRLKQLFEYVYIPKTQPNHEEFPLDWNSPGDHLAVLSRAVFIASRQKIANEILSSKLLDQQIRHE